jgi:hypothetical protein
MRSPLTLLGAFTLLSACSGNTSETGDFNVIEEPNYPDAPFVPETVIDEHAQVGIPAVDVLWVVDNSRSMYEEQQSLNNNFTSFLRFFQESEMDFHIGVVSTGWDAEEERGVLMSGVDRRGKTLKWLDNTVRDAPEVFRQMSLLGTDGPMDEKGRAQVYTALQLKGDSDNAGFLRRDAFLSVIVLSDEDDFSGTVPIGLDNFIRWLPTLKDDASQVSFSSIVGPSGGCGNAVEGIEYLAVTRALGGVEHSICESSWATILEDLGMQAAGLRDEFSLSRLPDVETLEGWMIKDGDRSPLTLGIHFEYERSRNVVRFTQEVPPPEARIFFQYEVAKSGD